MKWHLLKQLKSLLKSNIVDFFVASSYLTIVPVPFNYHFNENSLQSAIKYLSWVGAIIGVVVAGLFYVMQLIFPSAVALLLVLVASIVLTGAFHEDGLSDFFDGLGGWYDREKFLKIMKDSRIGNYGALASISVFLIKFTSLSYLSVTEIVMAVILANIAGRILAITYFLTHEYVREKDNSYYKPMMKQAPSLSEFLFALSPLLIAILIFSNIFSWQILFIIPVLVIFQVMFGRFMNKMIGGYTGDVLGAAEQLSEVLVYLTLLLVL